MTLIQEANLAMTAYIGDSSNALIIMSGRIRLKKVDRKTLLNVLKGIDEAVKELIEGSLNMLIDEQTDVQYGFGKNSRIKSIL